MDIFDYSKVGFFITTFLVSTVLSIYMFYQERTMKTKWFMIFAGLSIVSLVLGIVVTLAEPDEVKKINETTESARDTIRADISKLPDTNHLKRQLGEMADKFPQSPKQPPQIESDEKPILDVYAPPLTEMNPFIKEEGNRLRMKITILSIDGKLVKNMRESYVSIQGQDDEYKIIGRKPDSDLNESGMLYNDVGQQFDIGIIRSSNRRIDTIFFLYFRVKYENRLGKEQPPLRKIYRVSESLTKNGGKPKEVPSKKFNSIKDFLKKENIW